MKITCEKYQGLTPRQKRNQLLADSDWSQLPDTRLTAEQRMAWAEYREALRNMTFTENITWPRAPEK